MLAEGQEAMKQTIAKFLTDHLSLILWISGSLLVVGLLGYCLKERSEKVGWGWTGALALDYRRVGGEYIPPKLLWDYAELFIVPASLAVLAYIFNRSEKRLEYETAERRRQEEQAITLDRNQEATLQGYLGNMANLLVDENAYTSIGEKVGPGVKDVLTPTAKSVAQTLTTTALRKLDKERRNMVIQFLRDSGHKDLMTGASMVGIDLSGTNLSGMSFEKADLKRANLTAAIMIDANLNAASLDEANLTGANLLNAEMVEAQLPDAIIINAELSRANLRNANVSPQQLQTVRSRFNAIMPGGQRWTGA